MSQPEVGGYGGNSPLNLSGWMQNLLHLVPVALLLTGAWIAGCSCEDDKGDFAVGADPELLVAPQSLSFAGATVDRPETLTLTISNVGTGQLTDFSYSLEKNEGPFTFEPPTTTSLGQDESMLMEVTYRPDDEQVDSDVLIIEASNGQSARVPLNSLPPRRELQCVPEPIVINGGEIGEPIVATFQISNIGTLAATVSGLNIEADTGEFVITNTPELSQELRPEDTMTVEVTFTPQTGGGTDNTLRILTDEAPGLFTCNLRGTTPLPQISVTPPRIDFGSIPTGESVTADITVENVGTAPLVIQPPAFLRDSAPEITFVDPPTEEFTVEPGGSTLLTASYTADASTATATAILVNNDLSNPQVTIPMLGRPERPDIAVSPESINYGNVGQGAVSTRTLTIFNNGTQDLIVNTLAIDGTGEFYVEPDGNFLPTTDSGDGTIPPQGSVDVRVTYAPMNLGQDFATLNITSNDPDEGVLGVALTANGLDRAECQVQIRPEPLNFGLVVRGSTKVLSANVINNGSGPCTYRGANAQGILNNAFSIQGSSIGVGEQFNPGETLLVEVAYNPTSADLNNGKLTVDITDPTNGDSTVYCNVGARCQQNPNDFACNFDPPVCGVDLTGFAGPSDIAVIPGTLDFGLVTLGCSSQVTTITVYNTGVADLTVFDVRLGANCSDEFELRGVPPLPQQIDPANPVPIQVVYRPADLGADSCTLEIESDASEGEPILRVPLRGEGTNLSRQVDVFEQVSGREVDVLFVIDGSGSMSEEQSNVANNLGQFLATAELLDNDFHVGVTHLDLSETKEYGGVRYEAGQLMGNPSFLTPDTPGYLAEFQNRVRMGASGGSREAGLEAARDALSDPNITEEGSACNSDADCSEPYNFCSPNRTCGGRNAGFLREDASLEIIMLSDEEDQSDATPAFYTDFFRSIKGFRNDALLHVSSIVGANVGTNVPDSCESGAGSAEAGRRYAAVSDATGGSVGSICANNFGPFLQNIGNRAFGLRVEFFLSRAAEPATIEVRVNGSPRNSGWTYDDNTNSIVFERNSVPQPGDTIEVEYEARCFP